MNRILETKVFATLAACWIGFAGLLSGCGGEPETETASETYFINGREVPAEFFPDAFWDVLDSHCELTGLMAQEVEAEQKLTPADLEQAEEYTGPPGRMMKKMSTLQIDQLEQIDKRNLPPELKNAFKKVFAGPRLGDMLAQAGLNSQNLEIRHSLEARGEGYEETSAEEYRLSAGTLSCTKRKTLTSNSLRLQ